jgi:hypothetical protein
MAMPPAGALDALPGSMRIAAMSSEIGAFNRERVWL